MDPDGNSLIGFFAGLVAGALGFGQLYSTLTMVIGIARSIQAIANGADPKAAIGSWLLGYAISAVINPIVNGVLKGISRRVEASSFNLAEATGLKAASGTNTRGARYYRKSITISNQSFVDGNSELNAILSHPDFENIANEVLALSNYQAGHISEMQEVSGWLHLKDGKLRLASVDLDPRATHKSTYMKPAPKLKGGILVHFHTHPSVGIYYKHPTNGKSVATRLRPSDADITYAGDYGSGIIIGGNRKVLGYTPLY